MFVPTKSIKQKPCNRCMVVKDLSEFQPHHGTKDKLMYCCSDCYMKAREEGCKNSKSKKIFVTNDLVLSILDEDIEKSRKRKKNYLKYGVKSFNREQFLKMIRQD